MSTDLAAVPIDPACGTGGFLIEAFRSLSARIQRPESVRTWAHRNVFGVDKDSINIKLARAMMMVLGDGSANVHIGDSIREDRWKSDYPALSNSLKDGTFTVVLTNPPFGENLKVSAKDCRTNGYTISHAAGGGTYKDIEIGLVFLERAHRLLSPGGRLAIILPETYFFSPSYAYIRGWLADRFIMRGVVSIPMEAFQGFCRAKTNLYVLEKVTPTAASAVEEDLARNTVAKPARTRRLKNPRPASAGHAATQTGSGAA